MIHRPFLYKELQECDREKPTTEGKQMGRWAVMVNSKKSPLLPKTIHVAICS